MRRYWRIAAVAISCIIALASVASADKKRKYERNSDDEVQQDDILSALKRNEVRPMADSLAVAERTIPGQVIGVKAKQKSGRLVYEFKIIAVGGRIREVYVDALSLDVVKVE